MFPTLNFSHTKRACCIGYVVQAIVNNFLPLLFVVFQNDFHISLEKLALLASYNFAVQLFVDLLATFLGDRIRYRPSVVIAQFLSAVGLFSLGIFPFILPDPYIGLLLSTTLNALGSGMIEVLISPIMEGCPSDSKSGAMSILHSFYCWGQAAVVLLATLFFFLFGIENWRYLAMLWAIIPIYNGFLFCRVPLRHTVEKENAMPLRAICRDPLVYWLALMMLCAGACELAMSQWSSAFAEQGLGVSKSVGDIFGFCLFALLMGSARLIYSLFSAKISLNAAIGICSVLCFASYLLATVVNHPLVNLVGCALCGLSVGIFWPGTFSLSAKLRPNGGTSLFGLLALFGDLGCVIGTGSVGLFSGLLDNDFKKGLLCAAVFPILMMISLLISRSCIADHHKNSGNR